jgi:subtilisin family serine protease
VGANDSRPLGAAQSELAARPLASPLLRSGGGATEADRNRYLYRTDDGVAVLIELDFTHGIRAARASFDDVFHATFDGQDVAQPIPIGRRYLRCVLTEDQIKRLSDAERSGPRSIFRIWPDFKAVPHIDASVATVKVDAATRSYGTSGDGIVWAVIDSGIDVTHRHWEVAGNLTDESVATLHRDFTPLLNPRATATDVTDDPKPALIDASGHGTHVAGIIAGSMPSDQKIVIAANQPTSENLPNWTERPLDAGHSLSGMAPKARLVSLKVLDDGDHTLSSVVLAALDYVKDLNADGQQMIHGVNISIGCDWYPDEYAAGQSPLCQAVDDLVNSGVVVVVSAGNNGDSGTGAMGDIAGRLSTITDPGNAAKAITVGSTHRFAPHTYGISDTSSKGPTLDGRLKPDLVAPGERITSAATGALRTGVPPLDAAPRLAAYVEATGTSMSAAHVSGAVAAFLSVRKEFIGQPDVVKSLFRESTTSLDRHEFYQGAGMLDLMRVLSNV